MTRLCVARASVSFATGCATRPTQEKFSQRQVKTCLALPPGCALAPAPQAGHRARRRTVVERTDHDGIGHAPRGRRRAAAWQWAALALLALLGSALTQARA